MMTKAILVASGSGCLELLVDRPFVLHVVDQLSRAGVREIDVLAHRGAGVEAELGDGERWGLELRYHDPLEAGGLDGALLLAQPGLHDEVLLARGDVLVPPDAWSRPLAPGSDVEVYRFASERASHARQAWTGWCRMRGHVLGRLGPFNGEDGLLDTLLASACASSTLCEPLSGVGPAELYDASQHVIFGRAPYLRLNGRRGADGNWLERGVRVDPTATLKSPVYLGELVDIGPHAVVGPSVVVGAASVVDAGVMASDSIIPPSTYVSAGALLRGVSGSRARGLERSNGGRLSPEIGAMMIDLESASVAAAVRPMLARWLQWLARVGLAPVRAALRLVQRMTGRPFESVS